MLPASERGFRASRYACEFGLERPTSCAFSQARPQRLWNTLVGAASARPPSPSPVVGGRPDQSDGLRVKQLSFSRPRSLAPQRRTSPGVVSSVPTIRDVAGDLKAKFPTSIKGLINFGRPTLLASTLQQCGEFDDRAIPARTLLLEGVLTRSHGSGNGLPRSPAPR
jgi:hypothetical protein